MLLSESDFREALDLIAECEHAADVASFGQAVLGITRLVPGAVAYNEIDLRSGNATALVEPAGLAGEGSIEEFGRLAHQNPLVVHGRQGDPPRTISDILSARSFRALEIYGVVFRPHGFEDQIAVHLRTPSMRVAGFAINRERRGFSERERTLLALLAPHLGRAYADALERERSAALQAALERGLGAAGGAAIVIGPEGQIERLDEYGAALLGRFFGPIRERELPAALRSWLDDGSRSGGAIVVDDERGGRLRARLVECDGDPHWRAILLEELDRRPDPERLRALGLSPREAEVLAWVARGRSDIEIGALLSISPRTVDKHLEHIFRKLGARNRAEAVARGLS